jgi:hypothetical protein
MEAHRAPKEWKEDRNAEFERKSQDCFWATFIQQIVTSLMSESPTEKLGHCSSCILPPTAGLLLLLVGKHWLELSCKEICHLSMMTEAQQVPTCRG